MCTHLCVMYTCVLTSIPSVCLPRAGITGVPHHALLGPWWHQIKPHLPGSLQPRVVTQPGPFMAKAFHQLYPRISLSPSVPAAPFTGHRRWRYKVAWKSNSSPSTRPQDSKGELLLNISQMFPHLGSLRSPVPLTPEAPLQP